MVGVRRTSRRTLQWSLGAAALLATAVGCRHTAVDLVMTSAYRPPGVGLEGTGPEVADADDVAARFQVLAGDFHCHVSPPDWDQEANRDLAETVVLARKERLDFLVLTPHVGARFFLSEIRRRAELAALADLRDEIAKQGPGAPLLIAGSLFVQMNRSSWLEIEHWRTARLSR